MSCIIHQWPSSLYYQEGGVLLNRSSGKNKSETLHACIWLWKARMLHVHLCKVLSYNQSVTQGYSRQRKLGYTCTQSPAGFCDIQNEINKPSFVKLCEHPLTAVSVSLIVNYLKWLSRFSSSSVFETGVKSEMKCVTHSNIHVHLRPCHKGRLVTAGPSGAPSGKHHLQNIPAFSPG